MNVHQLHLLHLFSNTIMAFLLLSVPCFINLEGLHFDKQGAKVGA